MQILIISDDSHRTAMAEAVAEHLQGEVAVIPVAEITRQGFQAYAAMAKPNLILSCGQIAAPHAVAFKQLFGDVPTVSILDPGEEADFFDLIVTPNHEPIPRYDGVFVTTGYLNKVNPARLARAKADFEGGKYDYLQQLPLQSPVFALLVGGVHVGDDLTEADITAITDFTKAQGGTVLATTSPRTPMQISQALHDYLAAPYFLYDFKRRAVSPNPYTVMLALADHIIVTGDSARMVSEAVSSGKPAWIYAPEDRFFQYQSLHQAFYRAGKAAPLSAFDAGHPFELGLNEAARVAEYIAVHYL